MKYQPKPIDTSAVQFPAELESLMEDLSRNTHENWAAERLEQGWTWGPERSDAEKKHPCLVPYEQLEEAEKEFDRRTAREALKVILALGFRISK